MDRAYKIYIETIVHFSFGTRRTFISPLLGVFRSVTTKRNSRCHISQNRNRTFLEGIKLNNGGAGISNTPQFGFGGLAQKQNDPSWRV